MTAPEPGITPPFTPAFLDTLEGEIKRGDQDSLFTIHRLLLLDLCAAARRGVEAGAEIAQIRDALTGDDYASLPSDFPTVRMAHTIRADHDKFRNQVRDTCRRAETAEAALAAAVRREREAIELLRQAREYTTKYNAIRGPAARSFPDGNPENAIQMQSGPRPTEHAASPAASIGESE